MWYLRRGGDQLTQSWHDCHCPHHPHYVGIVSFIGTSRWLVGSSKTSKREGISIIRTSASIPMTPVPWDDEERYIYLHFYHTKKSSKCRQKYQSHGWYGMRCCSILTTNTETIYYFERFQNGEQRLPKVYITGAVWNCETATPSIDC